METQTGKEGVLGLQDLKKYMQKVNHKIPTATLKEKFTKYTKKDLSCMTKLKVLSHQKYSEK